MKKVLMLAAAMAFASAAVAQTAPNTEVKVRDNGTTKVVTTTGKTNVGAALDNTADAAGNVASKTGHAIKRGARKTGRAVKRTSQKASRSLKHDTKKLENKTE